VGPSTHKSALDGTLDGRTALSDMALVVREHVRHEVDIDSRGALTAHLHPDKVTAELAVPMTEAAPLELAAADFMNRCVAIDLNAGGLGWAVFEVRPPSGERPRALATGYTKVRSLAAMSRRLRRYEQVRNERQKFQQAYNVNMASVRDSVLGHVCHAINNLCAEFNAFPVIEMPGDSGDDPNVRRVFEGVMQRYTFSGTDAHKADRRQYWMGAELWTHPTLKAHVKKDGLATGAAKPLNLFPGAAVGNWHNSIRCAHCGRDPVAALDDAGASAVTQLSGANTRVRVADGTLLLAQAYRHHSKVTRRRAEATATKAPPPMMLSKDDIVRLVRDSLRAPSHRPGRSRADSYRCVYEDCRADADADVNAALNAGERWLTAVCS